MNLLVITSPVCASFGAELLGVGGYSHCVADATTSRETFTDSLSATLTVIPCLLEAFEASQFHDDGIRTGDQIKRGYRRRSLPRGP